MHGEKKPFTRNKIEAGGNAVLLLVVDSGGLYWHNTIVDESITYALIHFGIPYCFLDINKERIDRDKLSNCAAVVLAQNLADARLSNEEASLIAEAVILEGIGFAGFDNDIRHYSPRLLEMFSFENIDPYPCGTDRIRISTKNHYITSMQQENKFYNFNRAVSCISVGKWSSAARVLAEGVPGEETLKKTRHITPYSALEPKNLPCVFAVKWGKGKAIQYLINPRVWTRNCFGHAQGIDDIFFRSLIWICIC